MQNPLSNMSIEKALSFLPESLHTFLQVLFPTRKASKNVSLGQAIILVTRGWVCNFIIIFH